MGVGKFLSRHKKLNYLQRTFRRRKDGVFVSDVMTMDKDPAYIKICNIEKADGKVVYLARTMGCDGLFAEIKFLLGEIYFADKIGAIPTAMLPENSFYAEEGEFLGTKNPLLYYFDPISKIPFDKAETDYAYIRHNWVQRGLIFSDCGMTNNYAFNDEYLKKSSDIYRKYFKFNKTTKDYLSSAAAVLNGKKILGVHVRGADFKRGYKNHPYIVTVEEYLKTAKEEFASGDYDGVFLATDDSDAAESFKSAFKDKLFCFEDVTRTDGDESVMKSTIERENHHYLLGLEAIRDMYCLSLCDGLLAGKSNVSIFSRIQKLADGGNYKKIIILDKGIKQ